MQTMRHLPLGLSRTTALGLGSVVAVVLGLGAVGVLGSGGSMVFALALGSAAVGIVEVGRSLSRGEPGLRALRRVLLPLVIVAVALAFDPASSDSFSMPKASLLVAGTVIIAGLWAAERVIVGRPARWRSALAAPVLALLAWTVVATAAGVSPRYSLLGAYASYDGLIVALSFGLLFFAFVDAFELDDLPAVLGIVWFAAGGIVVLYGLMQLHDRVTTLGGRWEWVGWSMEADFARRTIWSTLANPNHLAGFLAMLLPLGAALALVTSQRSVRLAVGVLALPMAIELIQTGTAGAWLGVLAAGAVGAAVLAPELSDHRRVALRGGAVALALLVGTSALIAPTIGSQLGDAFDLGESSTVSQRFGFWRAAVSMASDDPLTGVGPDGYQLQFPSHQDARFVRFLGPSQVVNGPHNVLLSYGASGGIPALAGFGIVLALAAALGIGSWRRLRRRERDQPELANETRRARFLLAGVAAALAAFVVQASFNVYQVALYLLFWILLGALAVVARAAGGPTTLRALLRPPTSGGDPDPSREPSPAVVTYPEESRSRLPLAAGIAIAVTGLLLTVVSTRPYRAERALLLGQRLRATAGSFVGSDPDRAGANLLLARRQLERATQLSPWQAVYPAALARLDVTTAQFGLRQRPAGPMGQRLLTPEARLAFLRSAASGFEDALRIEPGSSNYLGQLTEVLLLIAEAQPNDDEALPRAAALCEAAVAANPWQGSPWYLLSIVRERQGDAAKALRAAEKGLALAPQGRDLLARTALLRERGGDVVGATVLRDRLVALPPPKKPRRDPFLAEAPGPLTQPGR